MKIAKFMKTVDYRSTRILFFYPFDYSLGLVGFGLGLAILG